MRGDNKSPLPTHVQRITQMDNAKRILAERGFVRDCSIWKRGVMRVLLLSNEWVLDIDTNNADNHLIKGGYSSKGLSRLSVLLA